MAYGKYDLNIQQGTLFDKGFTWKIDGTPVDLTGYAAKMRFYNAVNPNLITLTTTLDGDGNGIILGNSQHNIRIVLKTDKTADLAFRKAKHEMQLIQPNGEERAFLKGNVYVEPEHVDP
jgi:hypothetical protein